MRSSRAQRSKSSNPTQGDALLGHADYQPIRPIRRALGRSLLLICAFSLFMGLAAALGAFDNNGDRHNVSCSECHACEEPSASDPCLKSCPRPEAMSSLSPDLGPETVMIGDLANLYGPTRFNHRAHAEMAAMTGGCATCHHNTPAGSAHPTCGSCHTSDINLENPAQPGLRGVFHRLCLNCHSDWNKDTACENCHQEGQDATALDAIAPSGKHQGMIVEDLIMIPTNYAEGDQIPFHHKRHNQVYGYDCAVCHEREGCKACHGANTKVTHEKALDHPAGPKGQKLAAICNQCHGKNSCDHCHGRSADNLFSHPKAKSLRQDIFEKMTCRGCHGHGGPYTIEKNPSASMPPTPALPVAPPEGAE